jgi:hypothetical protein
MNQHLFMIIAQRAFSDKNACIDSLLQSPTPAPTGGPLMIFSSLSLYAPDGQLPNPSSVIADGDNCSVNDCVTEMA